MRKAEIGELGEGDLGEVVAFLERQHGSRPNPEIALPPSVERLRWLTFGNPARDPSLPLGWTLRGADGALAGLMLCVPQWFRYRDDSFRLLMSGTYFVDESLRGFGLALFQRYRALGARNALFCTTANEMSSAVWQRFGGYPLAGTDAELVGAIRWGPLIEESVVRRAGPRAFARVAAIAGGLVPAPVASRRARRDATLAPLVLPAALDEIDAAGREAHAERITALRGEPFVRWRYFDGPDATRALFRFEGSERALCWVGVNVQRRGYRGQIRALTVLDVWGRMPGAAVAELAACLAHEYRDRADIVVFRGQPPDREAALRSAGFLKRKLAVPIGWCIDRAGLLPKRDWYLVPADGDMAA